MSQQGGLSYQMMKALQAIFRPGGSRHEDKQHGRNQDVIRSIGTMQSMVADVHEFARFIRRQWPEVSEVEDVEPEMAQTFVEELIRRERSGGRIGRVMASLRKLDRACRITGVFGKASPPLLPYKTDGGLGGFHSEPRPVAYFPEQAERIIEWIINLDPISARVLHVMQKTGYGFEKQSILEHKILMWHSVLSLWKGMLTIPKVADLVRYIFRQKEKSSSLRSKQLARKIQPVTSSMTAALSRIGCANRCVKRVKPSEFFAWARMVSGKLSRRKTIKTESKPARMMTNRCWKHPFNLVIIVKKSPSRVMFLPRIGESSPVTSCILNATSNRILAICPFCLVTIWIAVAPLAVLTLRMNAMYLL